MTTDRPTRGKRKYADKLNEASTCLEMKLDGERLHCHIRIDIHQHPDGFSNHHANLFFWRNKHHRASRRAAASRGIVLVTNSTPRKSLRCLRNPIHPAERLDRRPPINADGPKKLVLQVAYPAGKRA